MAKKIPYTFVFERTRVLGSVIQPDDLHFETELAPGQTSEPLILHISCQVINVPHVAYLAQKIMQKMGLSFTTLGGPENCCGAYQWHFGDLDLEKQIAKISLGAFQRATARTVVSICPSCDDSFGRHKVANHTFRHCNIADIFVERLDELRAMMKPVPCRIVLHDHDADEVRQRNSANVRKILEAIPGIEILPSQKHMGPGIGCQSVAPMPADDTATMFREAAELKADYLVVPYHSCYRQHCKMQLQFGVEVEHYLSLMAKSLGIPYEEKFKELRLLDSVDAAVERLRPKIQQLGYKEEDVRKYVAAVIYM
jgi:Fe-S oxidoreductase